MPEEATYSYLLGRSLSFAVSNHSVAGSFTGSAPSRMAALLHQQDIPDIPDVVVLALGTNDGLKRVDAATIRANLAAAIRAAKAVQAVHNNKKVLLVGMRIHPSFHDAEYSSEFADVFPDLAREFGVPLVPFLLEGVGGVPEMNQADGFHPNDRGHERMAETVRPYLAAILLDQT